MAASAAAPNSLLHIDIANLLCLKYRQALPHATVRAAGGLGTGQARLLCARAIAANASAVLSAAITGLTTGTPTSAPSRRVTSGRKAMLIQPSTNTSAPSSWTA